MASITLVKTVHVNVYEVDKHYGGPEEGGWWYSTGRAIDTKPVEVTGPDVDFRGWTPEVHAAVIAMEAAHPKTGDSSSVVYRGGDYRVTVENHPAVDYDTYEPWS